MFALAARLGEIKRARWFCVFLKQLRKQQTSIYADDLRANGEKHNSILKMNTITWTTTILRRINLPFYLSTKEEKEWRKIPSTQLTIRYTMEGTQKAQWAGRENLFLSLKISVKGLSASFQSWIQNIHLVFTYRVKSEPGNIISPLLNIIAIIYRLV